MTQFALLWSTLKSSAIKSGTLPPGLVLSLSQGRDLGPALTRFDKAKKADQRSQAVAEVLKARTGYLSDFRDALKEAENSHQKAGVQKLAMGLEELWIDLELAAQPPRPSGSMVSYEALRNFNLASELKLEYLDVKATHVTVVVEIDSVLDKLIKAGKESLKVAHLGDVAKATLEKIQPQFTATLREIEKNIKSGKDTVAKKVPEANEVLRYYARIVEDTVNRAVATEWAKYLARAQHLSDFKVKSGVKITLGVVGAGVAVASLALSFGTAWMSIIAIAKGVAELVQNVSSLCQGIEKTHASLEVKIKELDKLNKQREAAREKNGGQKASKTKEAAKELANALMPLTKLMTKSTTTVESDAKQLLGQVSKMEVAADNAVGAMNKALKLLNGLPDKGMTDVQTAAVKQMDKAMGEFFTRITALHKEAQRYGDFGDKALTAVQTLKKSDSWSAGLASSAAGVGTKVTALYAAANFVAQCANAGKSLIPV